MVWGTTKPATLLATLSSGSAARTPFEPQPREGSGRRRRVFALAPSLPFGTVSYSRVAVLARAPCDAPTVVGADGELPRLPFEGARGDQVPGNGRGRSVTLHGPPYECQRLCGFVYAWTCWDEEEALELLGGHEAAQSHNPPRSGCRIFWVNPVTQDPIHN